MILSIECLVHKKQNIEFIDISKQQQKKNRAFCLECLQEGGQFEKICQIKHVPAQINAYCDQVKEKLNQEQNELISKINGAKKIIDNYRMKILKEFDEMIIIFQDSLNQLTKKYEQEKEKYSNLTKEITITKLEIIGNMLSGNHISNLKSDLNNDVLLSSTAQIITSLNSLIAEGQIKIEELRKNVIDQVTLKSQLNQEDVCWMLVSNQKKKLVVGGRNFDIVIWEQTEYKLQETFTLNGHSDNISALVIYESGEIIVSGGWKKDKTIKLWKKQFNEWNCIQTMNDHNSKIHELKLTKNEKYLLSVGNIIRVWIMKQPCQLECIQALNDHTNTIYWISISEDSRHMVSSSSEKYFNIYSVEQTQTNPCKILTKIQTNGKIRRVYFIKSDEVLVQQEHPSLVIVYQKNQSNKFQAIQEIILNQSDNNDLLFSIFQIDNRFYLKNDRFIYIITRLRTGKYFIQQILAGLYYSGCRDNSGEGFILRNFDLKSIDLYV